MGPVFVSERIDVGILIRIVVGIGHLAVVVDVGGGEPRRVLCRVQLGEALVEIGRRDHVLRGGIEPNGIERRMRIVEPGIEDGDDRARTVVSGILAVENTRVIDVDVVRDELRLGPLIFLADRGLELAPGECGDEAFVIPRLDDDFETAHQHVVIGAEPIGDARIGDKALPFVVETADARRNIGALGRIRILRYRRITGESALGVVCLQNAVVRRLDDDGDLSVVAERIGKFFDDVGVEILGRPRIDGIFDLRDERGIVLRGGTSAGFDSAVRGHDLRTDKCAGHHQDGCTECCCF